MVNNSRWRGNRWRCVLTIVLLNFAVLMTSSAGAATIDVTADVECLALTIYFEARGEPDLGKQAVAHVVMNRSHNGRFPRRICDVVREQKVMVEGSCQFTWT
jgi:spore germination cell wall hydrolase CwlJ-like protein